MFNSPGNQGRSIGLSVGATNLAGTRDGQTAVIRPAEMVLRGQRLTGFVDRVGDPVPLIAPDGATYRSEELLADALGAMAHAVTDGMPMAHATVTVPAHWRPSVVDTLRRNLRGKLPVVSDATAALTALRAKPGLPTHGVIVLCDFGGSGTSITLANAARDFSTFGETVRFADFSGDQIDQALLSHVVTGLADVDPSGTAMVGSLVRLRDECRRAKERLSAETAAAVVADLPGHRADIRVTRTELEDLMRAPLSEFLATLDETLERYGVPKASVAAVATIGGGARIPLVTQRLSEHLRAPVVTTPHPQLTAAEGAALIAQRARVVDTATVMTPTAPAAAASAVALAASEQALAWSQDDQIEDVLPYSDVTDSRPEVVFRPQQWQEDPAPPRRSPLVLFGLSAVAATIAAAVFGFTLLQDTTTTPVEAATTSTSTTSPTPAAPATLPATPAPQAPQITTVVVQQPAPRYQAPRQAPVTHQPYVPPATPPTTTSETPPTTDPTPPTPPTPTPPTSSSPKPPPIDPGPGGGTGTGGTGTGTGTGGTGTGTGTGGTGTGTGTGTGGTGTGTGTSGTGTGSGTTSGTSGTGSGTGSTGSTGTGAGGTSTTPQT